MDNAQKAIMIGVGLFITIIVISAVMLITGVAQDLLDSGNKQLGNLSSTVQNMLLDKYDQKTFSGSFVLSEIKDLYYNEDIIAVLYNETNDNTQTSVITPNKWNGGSITINKDGKTSHKYAESATLAGSNITIEENSSQINITKFSSKNDANYINPNGMYKTVLVQTDAGAVVGVAFLRYK